MNNRASSIQKLVRHIPLAASLIGMALILGSIAFFLSDFARVVGGATLGILALLSAVWYASNPFLRSTRRYLLLRVELLRFIGLAKELNAAVVGGASGDEIERARSRLHESVERIVAAAGKTEGPRGKD